LKDAVFAAIKVEPCCWHEREQPECALCARLGGLSSNGVLLGVGQ